MHEPKGQVLERPFYINAFPWVPVTFSLTKYLDPRLVYYGFYWCLRFFLIFFPPEFSFSVDILDPVCERGNKELSIEPELETQRGIGALLWSMSASLSYSSLLGLFVQCFSLGYLSISGTHKNQKTINVHIFLYGQVSIL